MDTGGVLHGSVSGALIPSGMQVPSFVSQQSITEFQGRNSRVVKLILSVCAAADLKATKAEIGFLMFCVRINLLPLLGSLQRLTNTTKLPGFT